MTDPTRLLFSEAIAYFRQKLNIPTDSGNTIQGEEYDWAFSVASVTSAEMLADFRAACDRYIAEGRGFEEFSKDFSEIATRYGWQPPKGQSAAWRANVVGNTNLRLAYAAGQWQQRQDPAVKKLRPGLMWRHRDSPVPRPHHKAMDGRVLDGNDPQWSGFSLPSGIGCRCRLYTVAKPDEGFYNLSDSLPYQLPNGKTTQVPAVKVADKLYPVADPGFFYTPGKSPTSARPAILKQMIERQPPALQKLIRKAIPTKILQRMSKKGFGM